MTLHVYCFVASWLERILVSEAILMAVAGRGLRTNFEDNILDACSKSQNAVIADYFGECFSYRLLSTFAPNSSFRMDVNNPG